VGASGCGWAGCVAHVRRVLRGVGVLRLLPGKTGESSPEDVSTDFHAACRRRKNGESSPEDMVSALVPVMSACDVL